MPMMPLASRAFHVLIRPNMALVLEEGFEAEQFGQAIAAIATHCQHKAHQDHQDRREGEDEVHQLRHAHQQVRQGCGEQGADGHLEGMAAAAFFPGDRQAFDGHGQNHHREQGYGQTAFQAEFMAEQTDHRDQHHHEGQHHRQPGQHLQLQVFEVGAQRQAQGGDHGKQDDAEAQLGFAEGQGDQHRGEGAECLQTAEVAQDQDYQHADRDHYHDHKGLLGMQRQAVQRVFEEVDVSVFVGQLGQANGVHFAVVQAETDLRLLAALQADQFVITDPPDQAIGRQALLARLGAEVQPALAIEAAQPELRALQGFGDQADGVQALHRHMGDGQQQFDDLGFVLGGGIAAQQQLDVVVVAVVNPLDGLGNKGFDVRRVLPDRGEQGLCGDLLGPFHGDAVAEDRTLGGDLLTAVTLGQYQAVVQGLLAAGAAGGPGDFAVAIDAVDAHAIVVRDKTLVEADVVLIQRRHKHLQFDRVARIGLELDFGIDIPQIVSFIFGHRDAEDKYLIARNQNAQTHQEYDQDFQMQVKRAHEGYSPRLASGVQAGFPAAYLRAGSTRAVKFFSASEPISNGYWKALRSVKFTSIVRKAWPMQISISITGRAVLVFSSSGS